MPHGLQPARAYPYERPPLPGDFGLTAGSSAAMWVTRIGTLSRYGHACLALDYPWTNVDNQRMIRIIEAQPRGARVRNAKVSEFRWSNVILTDEQREKIVERGLQCEGFPYDWPAILGFAARHLGYRLRIIGSKDKPDAKVICSELVVWAYQAGGLDLGQGKAPGDVSPGDLADYLVAH
jgi:uncharacterized protein YycO